MDKKGAPYGAERHSPRNISGWMVFAPVFLASLAFALYTNHAWEDWFITFRASANLARGDGLVYTVGERLHTFTSPLGTLLPALLIFVTGDRSDELVLWLFRLIGCGLLGLSAVMLLRIAQAAGMFLFPAIILIGLFGVDARIIDFSINGMEAALMMFFLTSFLYVVLVPTEKFVLKLGLSWAGLMWTRPDSFIYIAAISAGFLLFNPASPHFRNRRDMVRSFALAGLVTTALYLPWILWAWTYYGTPVPHTVIAKGLFTTRFDAELLGDLLTFPIRSAVSYSSVMHAFMPPYFEFGGWPLPLGYTAFFLSLTCTYAWCLPFVGPLVRAVSFALFLSHAYLSNIAAFISPWYIPTVTFLSIFVIGQLAQRVAAAIRARKEADPAKESGGRHVLLLVAGGVLLISSILLTAAIGYQLKLQQEIIESGNRKMIGLWLKENASSSRDRVFLECLGYIGYYSQLKMLDIPGLASSEVVETRRRLATDDFASLISMLHPDWLVLRPIEVNAIMEQMPFLLSTYYQQVQVFDVSQKVNAYRYIPGRQYLQYDQTFIVYRIR